MQFRRDCIHPVHGVDESTSTKPKTHLKAIWNCSDRNGIDTVRKTDLRIARGKGNDNTVKNAISVTSKPKTKL